MKVLVTLRDIERRRRHGGIGHYYKALRSHLDADVSYFTVGKREDRRGRFDDLRRMVGDYRRFWKQLSDGVDLVNLNPSLGLFGLFRDGVFLLMTKLRGKSAVVFFRGWERQTEAAIDRRWSWLFLRVFGRADGMIVLSGRFKGKLRDWGYRGPVWTETTAVGEGLLGPLPSKREESGTFNLLFLARIERDKGIYDALVAYRLLRHRNGDVRLTVVGDGSELRMIRRMVERSDIPDVSFPGYLEGDEKKAAFEAADVYLFPSTHGEGMPNSVLEAMAFGLPVVTTPAGGLAEFFEDGKMGFLANKPGAECLAGHVERLLRDRDLCRAIGAFNANYAREYFVASKVAGRLQGIWRDVLSASPGSETGRTWLPRSNGREPCVD